jgi:hypothetical protein
VNELYLLTMIPRLRIELCMYCKHASAEQLGVEIRTIAGAKQCATRSVFAEKLFRTLVFEAATIGHIKFVNEIHKFN